MSTGKYTAKFGVMLDRAAFCGDCGTLMGAGETCVGMTGPDGMTWMRCGVCTGRKGFVGTPWWQIANQAQGARTQTT